MAEHPILFSSEMVRALLVGRKTQTRRVVRPSSRGCTVGCYTIRCPYGVPGDRLWVREAWAARHLYDKTPPSAIPTGELVLYGASCGLGGLRGRPSIHMPRWASRLTLDVTSVRVERVQAISEDDALAEGVTVGNDPTGATTAREAFLFLWDRVNGARAPWASNPLVWVVGFRRVEEMSA